MFTTPSDMTRRHFMSHLAGAAVRECHEAGQLVRQHDGDA